MENTIAIYRLCCLLSRQGETNACVMRTQLLDSGRMMSVQAVSPALSYRNASPVIQVSGLCICLWNLLIFTLCIPESLSACLATCLFDFRLYDCPSVCLTIYLSFRLPPTYCMIVHQLSASLSTCLSNFRLDYYPSVHLSFQLPPR